jgi:hypothetical protein
MPITQSLNSKGNVKKFTNNDITPQLNQPAIASYYATSTASQTVINLPFYIDTSSTGYTDNFWLFVDGKKLDLGASNDYQFTNIGSDGNSNQVTLTASISANLNIQAFKMGLKPELTFKLDNRLLQYPTQTILTSGSGTYTVPAGVLYLKIKMVGGGGGGAGGGTAAPGAGGNGGNTVFGTSLLTANGGQGGKTSGGNNAGGTATVASPAVGIAIAGGSGGGEYYSGTSTTQATGGMGAASPFGGAGGGSLSTNASGGNASTNSGSGGGGGGCTNQPGAIGGEGGAAGGYVEAYIPSPSSSYTYTVGAGGAGGNAGTNGSAGGAGGSGVIIIEEHYIG